uniref:SRR1-like protein n=1 Tax=Crassostrea virginica TaxID=6565 RepID=A0A8B8F0N7_CRAVI|nr:SRR1-like protein [Crassostrea virginica]
MDGFQVVSRKKGKKAFVAKLNRSENKQQPPENISETTTIRRVITTRDSLHCTDFFADFRDKMKGCVKNITCTHSGCTNGNHSMSQTVLDEIVTYGLGNFSECLIARYQLALLLAMREDLKVPPNDVLLYDPKFFPLEKEVLRSFGLQVLSENEEAKRTCEKATLFYMPHCGKSLYNNLLYANWSPDRLCHVIIIGNSFTNMVQNLPSSSLKRSAPLIMKIEPFTEEVVFPQNFQYDDVFNDTVIHIFLKDKLTSLPAEFWENCSLPVYDEDDLEFIPKS